MTSTKQFYLCTFAANHERLPTSVLYSRKNIFVSRGEAALWGQDYHDLIQILWMYHNLKSRTFKGLTPCEWLRFEKLVAGLLATKIPLVLGSRNFVTVFKKPALLLTERSHDHLGHFTLY